MGKERFAGGLDEAFTLETAQAQMCSFVDSHAKMIRDRLTAEYSAGEMASWPIKRTEALAWQASRVDADAPFLSAEAAERGVTLESMVSRVLGNAAALAMLEARVAGVAGRHRDAIKALGDFDAIADYNYSVGWPG